MWWNRKEARKPKYGSIRIVSRYKGYGVEKYSALGFYGGDGWICITASDAFPTLEEAETFAKKHLHVGKVIKVFEPLDEDV